MKYQRDARKDVMMKINKSLLPLKAHFFVFWGSISSALPFMMVVARQLGVPVALQGTISAAIIAAAVFAKPVIAAAADFMPSLRKSIFLALLTLMVMTLGPIGFLPPLRPLPLLYGEILHTASRNESSRLPKEFLFRNEGTDRCYLTDAWDCMVTCENMEDTCPLGNHTYKGLRLKLTTMPPNVTMMMPELERSATTGMNLVSSRYNMSDSSNRILESHTDDARKTAASGAWNFSDVDSEHFGYSAVNGAVKLTSDVSERWYWLQGIDVRTDEATFNISVQCGGGNWEGEACAAPWSMSIFWLYVILLLVGQVAATTAESISDAICIDTIGENGDYGSQRAWGAISYGVLGTVSGLLVDWYSGTNHVKDYTPAFLLLILFGTIDVLLSAAYLKVPRFEDGTAMCEKLQPLLRQPKFFVFLCFALLIGFFDGIDTGYVFILQEDMAAGTEVMEHIKLLQGLTMLVQAISAAPFMFIYDWFMRKLGSEKVISLVLFLYAVRLLSLSLSGAVGNVWATVAIEAINGPCFGLGFTAIIVHAGSITPQGASATVQSIVSICYGTFGYAGASFFGGLLYEGVGGAWLYFATGMTAVLTCLLHLTSHRFFQQKSGEEMDDVELKEMEKKKNVNKAKDTVEEEVEGLQKDINVKSNSERTSKESPQDQSVETEGLLPKETEKTTKDKKEELLKET